MKKLGVIFIEVIINVFPTNFDIGVKNSIFFFIGYSNLADGISYLGS